MDRLFQVFLIIRLCNVLWFIAIEPHHTTPSQAILWATLTGKWDIMLGNGAMNSSSPSLPLSFISLSNAADIRAYLLPFYSIDWACVCFTCRPTHTSTLWEGSKMVRRRHGKKCRKEESSRVIAELWSCA